MVPVDCHVGYMVDWITGLKSGIFGTKISDTDRLINTGQCKHLKMPRSHLREWPVQSTQQTDRHDAISCHPMNDQQTTHPGSLYDLCSKSCAYGWPAIGDICFIINRILITNVTCNSRFKVSYRVKSFMQTGQRWQVEHNQSIGWPLV